MIRAATISLQLLAVALGMLFLTTRQAEAAPQTPMTLFGSVTVGGSPAPNGLLVEAKVVGSNINFAHSATIDGTPLTSGGQFGQGSDDFTILADDPDSPGLSGALNGNPMVFFIDGVAATITVIDNPGSTYACSEVVFPAENTEVSTYPFCLGSVAELSLATGAAAPTPTPTPVTSTGGGGGGGAPPPPLVPTPTPTLVPTPAPTLAPTPTAGPTPTPASASVAQEIEVSIEVVVTEEQTTELSSTLNDALGIDAGSADVVVVVAGTTVLEAVEPGRIEVTIEVTGLESGAEIVGDVDLTIGNMTVETTDGVGTGEIALAGGLTVVGDVTLVAEDGALSVVFDNPHLLVEPDAPAAADLTGGSAEVTHIDVSFDVGLETLPEGAALEIRFAKTADAFVDDVGAVFQLAAEQIFGAGQGTLEDAAEDIAFVVQVTRMGIENTDLGDNTITMEISREWYVNRIAQGKTIVITKIADDGTVTAAEASCSLAGEIASCTVTLTGDAGGFSVFAVIAVTQTPAPAPTATPVPAATATPVPTPTPGTTAIPTPTSAPTPVPATPTPTPTQAPRGPAETPTPTPTPAPPAPPGPGVAFIAIGVAATIVVAGGGAAAFVVLRRRRA